MYVIVPSKPGIYNSRLVDSSIIKQNDAYGYYFYGKLKAIFDLVEIEDEGYVEIIEEDPPFIKNVVATKFLEHFSSFNEAKAEINHLISFGNLDTSLKPMSSAN